MTKRLKTYLEISRKHNGSDQTINGNRLAENNGNQVFGFNTGGFNTPTNNADTRGVDTPENNFFVCNVYNKILLFVKNLHCSPHDR